LIQKPQICVFLKYLNLSKFKNIFGLNLNFEFKSNLLKRISKPFSIFHAQPKVFWPKSSLVAQHLFLHRTSVASSDLFGPAIQLTWPVWGRPQPLAFE
jgi:hypothetical protein